MVRAASGYGRSVVRSRVPQFFFSYARAEVYQGDDIAPYLDSFYKQLCTEVAICGGPALGLTGFLDREQPAGANCLCLYARQGASLKAHVADADRMPRRHSRAAEPGREALIG
jgi:hypothetical protein